MEAKNGSFVKIIQKKKAKKLAILLTLGAYRHSKCGE